MAHRILALAAALITSPCLLALAETYVDPDRSWWAAFTDTPDGTAPDLNAAAQQDPRYLAADEFTLAEVLATIITELETARRTTDPTSAEVVMSVGARVGDYDAARGSFPVSAFGPSTYLKIDSDGLHFRNWLAFNIFLADPEAGRALRETIGLDDVVAEVSIKASWPSATRRSAYDGHVSGIAYDTRSRTLLGRVDAAPAAVASPVDTAASADGICVDIEAAAGLPAIDTSWEDAKAQLAEGWPLVVSDAWSYTATGRHLAHVRRDCVIEIDDAHVPNEGFQFYLQQVEGSGLSQDGASFEMADILGQGGLSTSGFCGRLACGASEVPARCAVLTFPPRDGGHVLTGAFGVIEMPGDITNARALAELGAQPEAVSVNIMDTLLGYDVEDIRLARKAPITAGLGVATVMATAGHRRRSGYPTTRWPRPLA